MEIRIDRLSKVFGATRALDQVSLNIGQGMFGLLGPNGAGKTTLMRTVVTLLRPTSGTVTVGGFDAVRSPSAVRRLIGYLAQDFAAYRRLTALEFLDYVGLLKGVYDDRERKRQVAEVLDTVGLAARRRVKIGAYSGGMRRRLGIAQALLGSPPVLIVDEPTSGLDPEERVRFRNMLTALSKDRVVVLSTHIVADVEHACDALALLDAGRVVFSGTPDGLAGSAEGMVWEVRTDEAGYERLSTRTRVVAARREREGEGTHSGGGPAALPMRAGNGHFVVRVISTDEKQLASLGFSFLRPVRPSVEDGYMVMVRGRSA